MDNANSQARIELPELPSNVELLVGTSKTDFLNYIREWIMRSQITGINEEGAQSLDVNAINTQVAALQTDVDALNLRKPQVITVAGTNATTITVPLDEPLSSNIYEVSGVFVGGSGVLPDIGWSLVSGSKTTDEFQVKIHGDATAYSLELTVTPTHNL